MPRPTPSPKLDKSSSVSYPLVFAFCVQLICYAVVLMHVSAEPKRDGTVPNECCTSMNYEKILGYTIILATAFAMLKLKPVSPMLSLLLGGIVLACTVARIIMTSKAEETYSEHVTLGFWWHANWFTVGVGMAVFLKLWQLSTMNSEAYKALYQKRHVPWISTGLLAFFVHSNIRNYYRDADPHEISWAEDQLYTLYPIGHLRANGGLRFLISMLLWNGLTVVETLEGPFPTLLMLVTTMSVKYSTI